MLINTFSSISRFMIQKNEDDEFWQNHKKSPATRKAFCYQLAKTSQKLYATFAHDHLI